MIRKDGTIEYILLSITDKVALEEGMNQFNVLLKMQLIHINILFNYSMIMKGRKMMTDLMNFLHRNVPLRERYIVGWEKLHRKPYQQNHPE